MTELLRLTRRQRSQRIRRARERGERYCRECGCTETRACITHGAPCRWTAQNLCSACDRVPRDGAAA